MKKRNKNTILEKTIFGVFSIRKFNSIYNAIMKSSPFPENNTVVIPKIYCGNQAPHLCDGKCTIEYN